MNKRVETIKSLFGAPAPALSPQDSAPHQRVTAGAIRSVQDTFTEIERENEDLRSKIASAAGVVQIDVNLIDPSPLSDRLNEADDPSYLSLKQSIAQRGQEIPVLLRPHPKTPGRYQVAYGRRRIRVAKELDRPVKAIIRDLSDEELVIAQGLENTSREDLTFIEKALFAMNIEDAGYDRSVVQDALSVDRADASRLSTVARTIPPEIIRAIGKAPSFGRRRWLSLADLLKDKTALNRSKDALTQRGFSELKSDDRFRAVWAAASPARPKPERPTKAQPAPVVSTSGTRIASARHENRELTLLIDRAVSPLFASFVVDQIPALFDEFSRSVNHPGSPGV